jgi:hypothetical protein
MKTFDQQAGSSRPSFSANQFEAVNRAVLLAEELVSNHYKMSSSQWLGPRYDVKTLKELEAGEVIDGPFAQIIRYRGRRKNTSLGSASYDFYKICLQDHTILATLGRRTDLPLFTFALYIICHELIHIVRFGKFLQGFDASEQERHVEEALVHGETHQILQPLRIEGLPGVLGFFENWRVACDGYSTGK